MDNQGFHDYTIASNAERFTAVLESTISSWNDTGLDVIVEKGLKGRRYEQPSLITSQVSLKQRLRGWRRDPFLLALHVPAYVVAPDTTECTNQDASISNGGIPAETVENASDSNSHGSRTSTGVATSQLQQKRNESEAGEKSKDSYVPASPLQTSSNSSQVDSGQGIHSRSQSPELLTRRRTGRESSMLAISETGGIEKVPGETDADLKGEAFWQVGVNLDMQDLLQNIEAILQDGADSSTPVSETDTPDLGSPIPNRSSGARLSPIGPLTPEEMMSEESDRQQRQSQQQSSQPSPRQQEQQQEKVSSVTDTNHSVQHADKSSGQQGTATSVPISIYHTSLPQPKHSHNTELANLVPENDSNSKTTHQQSRRVMKPVERVSPARQSGSHDEAWWPQKRLYRPWWRYTHQHKLQHWFGLDHFLLLQPQSYSRRLLDESEANILMSCLSCALSNRQLAWPALIPVHDALRDAYWGQVVIPGASTNIASSNNENAGDDQPACQTYGGITARLITDSVHISGVSDSLLTLKGQLNLFAEQLAPSAPHTSMICRAASEHVEISQPTDIDKVICRRLDGHVKCSARYTLKLPLPSVQPGSKRASYSSSEATYAHDNVPWDLETAWWPWARHNDPVTCLELDLIWDNVCIACDNQGCSHHSYSSKCDRRLKRYTSSSSTTGDNSISNPWPMLNPSTASHWLLHAVEKGLTDDPGFGLDLQAAERQRQCVTLDEFGSPNNALDWTIYGAENDQDLTRSLHSMLTRLASLKPLLCSADTMGELAADSWWWDRKHTAGFSAGLPPPPSEAALLAALRDIWDMRQRSQNTSPLSLQCQYPRTAPVDSPLFRLALRCMTFGNARAVAVLWQRFIRSLRIDFWEAGKQLPLGDHTLANPLGNASAANTEKKFKATANAHSNASEEQLEYNKQDSNVYDNPCYEDIDLQACILHQKLQVLNICIARCQAATSISENGQDLNSQPVEEVQEVQGQEVDSNLDRRGSAVGSIDGSDIIRTSSNGNGNGGSEAAQQYYSADEDEEILGRSGMNGAQATPVGVAQVVTPGLRLTNHPERTMNAPILQLRPLYSEDRRAQRVQQLRGLRQIEGSEEAAGTTPLSDDALLSLEIVSSDMAAFKAANPGAILQDFIAWRMSLGLGGSYHGFNHQTTQVTSTDQLATDQLSTEQQESLQARVTEDNTGEDLITQHSDDDMHGWAYTWDTTAPCPAAAQKPLQDPFQEGERILHDLDTLAVADVVDSLLALGLSASCQLLANCRGASLIHPVAQLVHRFHRLSSVTLKTACSPPKSAPGSTPSGPLALSGNRLLSGFHELALDHLLEQFSFLEQAVVLSESLLCRLPGSNDLCTSLMTHVIHGKTTPIQPCTPPSRRLSSMTPLGKTDDNTTLTERLCTTQVTSVSDQLAITALLVGAQGVLLRELTPTQSMVFNESNGKLDHPVSVYDATQSNSQAHADVTVEKGDDCDVARIQAEQLACWDGFWPDAEVREWELLAGRCGTEMQRNSFRNGTTLDSRMFVQHTNAHTRIALTLVADS